MPATSTFSPCLPGEKNEGKGSCVGEISKMPHTRLKALLPRPRHGNTSRTSARSDARHVGCPTCLVSVGAANNRAGTAVQKDLFDGPVNVDHLLHHLERQSDVTVDNQRARPHGKRGGATDEQSKLRGRCRPPDNHPPAVTVDPPKVAGAG